SPAARPSPSPSGTFRDPAPPTAPGSGRRGDALAAGRVTVSRHPVLAPGDLVHGLFGVQEHAVSDGFARNVLTNCLNWPVDHGIHKGRDMCPVVTTIRQW